MNKKAIEALPALMAGIGGLAAFWMAGKMEAGIAMRIITGLITLVASYFIAYFIANK